MEIEEAMIGYLANVRVEIPGAGKDLSQVQNKNATLTERIQDSKSPRLADHRCGLQDVRPKFIIYNNVLASREAGPANPPKGPLPGRPQEELRKYIILPLFTDSITLFQIPRLHNLLSIIIFVKLMDIPPSIALSCISILSFSSEYNIL